MMVPGGQILTANMEKIYGEISRKPVQQSRQFVFRVFDPKEGAKFVRLRFWFPSPPDLFFFSDNNNFSFYSHFAALKNVFIFSSFRWLQHIFSHFFFI